MMEALYIGTTSLQTNMNTYVSMIMENSGTIELSLMQYLPAQEASLDK